MYYKKDSFEKKFGHVFELLLKIFLGLTYRLTTKSDGGVAYRDVKAAENAISQNACTGISYHARRRTRKCSAFESGNWARH